MEDIPDIYIDTREPDKIYKIFYKFIIENEQFFDLYVCKHNLNCGDFSFKSLGAERKTLEDFIGSIHDGRIFQQAFNMSETYEFCYLLISGDFTILSEKDLKAVYTTCSDFETRYNFKIMFFPTDYILVHYFLMLCLKLTQDLKPIWVYHKYLPTIKDEQKEILCGIYKCGSKTAKNLLLHFGNIKNIFNANIEELMKVKKIGKKTAKHIFEISNKIYDEIIE